MPSNSPEPTTSIGFIGLGAMGLSMATHILDSLAGSGGELLVTARRPQAAASIVESGAKWAETAADIAGRSAVVVTMLPDLPELVEVVYGDGGLLEGVSAPIVVVACSTSSPQETRQLGERLTADSGGLVSLVDAPVSGGVEGAADGTLSIFLGGEAGPVAQAGDVLNACGTCEYLGPLGSGQVAKAANQLIVAATTAALAEAMVIAERAGLDLAQLVPILGGGYAGSRLLEIKGHHFIDHDHSPASPAKFMIKDLRFAAQEADTTSTHAPMQVGS